MVLLNLLSRRNWAFRGYDYFQSHISIPDKEMFASKLLNILEALPTDDEHEDRVVSDTPEEKSTMKEIQEANSLAFPTKDILDLNVDVNCKETLGCDMKDMDELWKVSELDESVISDDVSRSNDSEVRASTVEDDLNEALPKTITSRRYGGTFECDVKDRDEKWNTPELEFSIIPDLIDEKGNDSVDPDSRFASGYKFFETDTKCVEEYELPELACFYKESSWNNAQPGTYVPIPADEDQHSNTTESGDIELSSAHGSKSSVESENNEEEDTKLTIPNDLNPGSPEEVYNDDDSEDTYLEDLVMIFGPKGTARWKHSNKLPNIDSSTIVTPRPEESKQPDQNPFEGEATDLFHHSELGTEAIVYNINSTKPASISNLDQGVKNFAKPSHDVANLGRSLRDFLFDSQGFLADEEASFASLRRGSGPIIYSRRISSFDRISVGSDGSTNSGESFAFPILQSERYTSPVRMVQEVEEVQEEEASHCQKHRGWAPVFICCKF